MALRGVRIPGREQRSGRVHRHVLWPYNHFCRAMSAIWQLPPFGTGDRLRRRMSFDGMAPTQNLYCSSTIWNLEQAQASGESRRLLSSTPW